MLTLTHRPSDSRLQWCGERNAAHTAHTSHTPPDTRPPARPAGGGAQEEIRENQNARARARAENPATATRDGGVRFALLRYTYTARRLTTGMHSAKKEMRQPERSPQSTVERSTRNPAVVMRSGHAPHAHRFRSMTRPTICAEKMRQQRGPQRTGRDPATHHQHTCLSARTKGSGKRAGCALRRRRNHAVTARILRAAALITVSSAPCRQRAHTLQRMRALTRAERAP